MMLLAIALAVAAPAGSDARAAYAGDWRGTGTFYATPYSTAGPSSGHTTCTWTVENTYLVCAQDFTGPQGAGHGLSIFTRSGSAYRFTGVDPDGKPRQIDLVVTDKGDVIWNSSFDDKSGKHVVMRTVNTFPSPGVEDWRTEYSLDGGKSWTRMADGVMHRVPADANSQPTP
jgi:hypothetical protein